jgi:hypothetical protein
MKRQLDGFWAQDIWPTTEIPVPDNDPDRHRKNRYLRFATHSSGVNAELKFFQGMATSYGRKWSNNFENNDGTPNVEAVRHWAVMLAKKGVTSKGLHRCLEKTLDKHPTSFRCVNF